MLFVLGRRFLDVYRLEQFNLQNGAGEYAFSVRVQGAARFFGLANEIDMAYSRPVPIFLEDGYYQLIERVVDVPLAAADRGQDVEENALVVPVRDLHLPGILMSMCFRCFSCLGLRVYGLGCLAPEEEHALIMCGLVRLRERRAALWCKVDWKLIWEPTFPYSTEFEAWLEGHEPSLPLVVEVPVVQRYVKRTTPLHLALPPGGDLRVRRSHTPSPSRGAASFSVVGQDLLQPPRSGTPPKRYLAMDENPVVSQKESRRPMDSPRTKVVLPAPTSSVTAPVCIGCYSWM